jgi:hypothetical protein
MLPCTAKLWYVLSGNCSALASQFKVRERELKLKMLTYMMVSGVDMEDCR